jgi:hypothetical protein
MASSHNFAARDLCWIADVDPNARPSVANPEANRARTETESKLTEDADGRTDERYQAAGRARIQTGTPRSALGARHHPETTRGDSSNIALRSLEAPASDLALSVNRELVLLYWSIGRDILARQHAEGWGTKVIDRLL